MIQVTHVMFLRFCPVLSGHPKSERSRSQGQGLLFRGTAKAIADPKDGGGAETRRGAKRKQKTAAPQGAARPWFRPSSEAVPERKGKENGQTSAGVPGHVTRKVHRKSEIRASLTTDTVQKRASSLQDMGTRRFGGGSSLAYNEK